MFENTRMRRTFIHLLFGSICVLKCTQTSQINFFYLFVRADLWACSSLSARLSEVIKSFLASMKIASSILRSLICIVPYRWLTNGTKSIAKARARTYTGNQEQEHHPYRQILHRIMIKPLCRHKLWLAQLNKCNLYLLLID